MFHDFFKTKKNKKLQVLPKVTNHLITIRYLSLVHKASRPDEGLTYLIVLRLCVRLQGEMTLKSDCIRLYCANVYILLARKGQGANDILTSSIVKYQRASTRRV